MKNSTTQILNNIPEKDFSIICDVVAHYPGKTLDELEKILRFIFLENINSSHFIMLGLAIGQSNTTVERVTLINQISNLCLRQN